VWPGGALVVLKCAVWLATHALFDRVPACSCKCGAPNTYSPEQPTAGLSPWTACADTSPARHHLLAAEPLTWVGLLTYHLLFVSLQSFCWLCGAATGRAHTWENISGHSCGRWKEEMDSRVSAACLKQPLAVAAPHKKCMVVEPATSLADQPACCGQPCSSVVGVYTALMQHALLARQRPETVMFLVGSLVCACRLQRRPATTSGTCTTLSAATST
jgi:hypothetical protein